MAVRRNAPLMDEDASARRWRWTDPEILTVLYLVVVSLVFVALPSIDMAVAGLFHDQTGFPASRTPALIGLRRANDELIILVLLTLAASLIGKIVWPQRPIAIRPRVTVFLLSSLILGPGLLVNAVFKTHWGRPRPYQVFDGNLPFKPAWEISHACSGNCSFVAGEASSAMWLFTLVLLAPRGLRLYAAIPLGAILIALSLNRMAFGGHFLSDVLIAWGLIWLIALLLRRYLVEGRIGAVIDDRVSAALAGFGYRLRRTAASK